VSDVSQLKEQLAALATEADNAGGTVDGFANKFERHIADVEKLIAGTATRADQEVVATLAAARDSAKQAVTALKTAARRTRDYANGL
jgi:putative N-acetylmannosamine-6-phosphate epimerase